MQCYLYFSHWKHINAKRWYNTLIHIFKRIHTHTVTPVAHCFAFPMGWKSKLNRSRTLDFVVVIDARHVAWARFTLKTIKFYEFSDFFRISILTWAFPTKTYCYVIRCLSASWSYRNYFHVYLHICLVYVQRKKGSAFTQFGKESQIYFHM